MVKSVRFVVLFFMLSCVSAVSAAGETLKVAVASNFYLPLQTILNDSKFKSNLVLSSGASGLLYAQIRQGAPFDVFLSADKVRPALLHAKRLANKPVTYAIGQLVIWPSRQPAAVKLAQYQGKLAIADPLLAPYGQAAMQVLQSHALLQSYQGRLIKAHNVNQAFQFVDSGNAGLALLSKAQLWQARMKTSNGGNDKYNTFYPVTMTDDSQIEQQLVILNHAFEHPLANEFVQWLLSQPVQQKLQKMGYLSAHE